MIWYRLKNKTLDFLARLIIKYWPVLKVHNGYMPKGLAYQYYLIFGREYFKNVII